MWTTSLLCIPLAVVVAFLLRVWFWSNFSFYQFVFEKKIFVSSHNNLKSSLKRRLYWEDEANNKTEKSNKLIDTKK